MKISGFTLVRKGTSFHYPYRESILSLLPLVDELIVNVGISKDDNTLDEIQKLRTQNSKIKIIESEWPLEDPEKRKGGQILAEQTNIALSACSGQWCLYLQADEILHEEDYGVIQADLERAHQRPEINGLVFQYNHFYGNYDFIQVSRSAYRREIRAIRNGAQIISVGDAQGFRHRNAEKVMSLLSRGRVFHYGWVRPQDIMKNKTQFMDSLYHSPQGDEKVVNENEIHLPTKDNYKFKRFYGLRQFRGTHPKIMESLVRNTERFSLESTPYVFHWKDLWKIVSGCIESVTGFRPFEYKNYRLSR
jgi:hypothetical protein